VDTDPASIVADAQKSAAAANAGAQTVQASRLQKFMWIFSPYRPDIQQGNFVSQEMLAELRVGQTREQVRFLLGSPLLNDMFHADRWDFPFYLARGNGELTTSRVTVYFKDDVVERFDGGNLPTEREYIARIAGPAKNVAREAKKAEAAATARPVEPSKAATPATSTTTP
jgi:outer membrane protein assembly factor BamE